MLRTAAFQNFQIFRIGHILFLCRVSLIYIHLVAVKIGRLCTGTECRAFSGIALAAAQHIGEVFLHRIVCRIRERQQIVVRIGEHDVRIVVLQQTAVCSGKQVAFQCISIQTHICRTTDGFTKAVQPF